MAKGMPSMVALLGLLAVAGYQNRDKLGAMLGDARNSSNPSRGQSGLGDMLGNLGTSLGGGAAGGGIGTILTGGLGDLMDRFTGAGQEQKAQSWVRDGANEPVTTGDLETTLGEDTLTDLQQQTGLSRSDLLDRLAAVLPEAVDRLTPAGRLPTADDASRY